MSQKRICFIQLARFGDVFSMLAGARKVYRDTGEKPLIVVADNFIDLASGIDYAEVHEWKGDSNDPNIPRDYFRSKGYEVLATQVAGAGDFPKRWCDNFTAEQWERAGMLADFHADTEGLIAYDDSEAMAWFKRLVGPNSKPVLAVNFSAKSAPLSAEEMGVYKNKILVMGRTYKILDLSDVLLPTIRLIPGILKRCAALLTIDTATLHLAGSVMRPTIALVPERHWHTPEPRKHWVGRFGYSEALTPDGWKRLDALLHHKDLPGLMGSMVRDPSEMLARHIVHVASTYDATGDDARRNAAAMDTWDPRKNVMQPDGRMERIAHEKFARIDHGETPSPVYTLIHRAGQNGAPDRTSAPLGDKRAVPFLKDVIDYALARCPTDRDIIMFTNADTLLVPEAWDMIRRNLHQAECVCSARADFKRIDQQIPWVGGVSVPPPYCGTDLFAFTARWWKKVRDNVPDVLLACEGWDAMLRWLVLKDNPNGNLRPVVCYHEWHDPFWAKHRFDNPGQAYNRKVLTAWCKANGYAKHLSDTAEWLFKKDEDAK